MNRRAAGGSLVPQKDTKLSYWVDSLLPSLWGRSSYPMELIYGSPGVLAYDEVHQEQHRCDVAVLLEGNHLWAATRAACYHQALRRYHSHKVHARSFEEGDLVLRHVQSAKNSNKLTTKWEGPYRVTRVTRPSAVRLETEDAIPVSNSWNIEHLRKFYP